MQVVIAGGSGFIGRKLINELVRQRHEVILLSRIPERTRKIFSAIRVEFWDAMTGKGMENIISGSDAVINLTGEPIGAKWWTSQQKQKILASRVNSTRVIVAAIAKINHKPSVLLNASAVGYYGDVPEGEVTETHPKGAGFLSDVCEEWELEALNAKKLGVRVVLLRTGIVLDKNGGALKKFLLPFRLFAGGPLGTGKQWFPWIHLQDEVNAILFAMENGQIPGPLNLSAPESARMSDFCKILGKILHRPLWLHIPSGVLRLALGEMAEPLLLHSQQVVPKKLMDFGFKFKFPRLNNALVDILDQ